MAASSVWSEVPPAQRLTPGKYRAIGTVRGAYNAATRAAVAVAMRVKVEAQGNTWVGFTSSPPLYNAHDFSEGPWVFTVRFDRPEGEPTRAGIDGRSIAVILALVASAALGLALLSTKLEKLVETLTNPLKPILSPGTIVLAVLAIFLLTRARGRTPV